ncbi:MAG: HNH endonuclease [Ardenticatenaceae bacterium]|nr:HNH endonuclease [Ardenticatenaceae bacterium]
MLKDELKLELNQDKTRISHIDDGFSFLGFDIKRYAGTRGKPVVLIKPSQKSIHKLKTKIKNLTKRDSTYQPAWYKLIQINQITRGWSAYFRHVNAKTTFAKLDWWVMNRLFGWARKKHSKANWHVINTKYKHRDPKGRINFVCHLEDGSPIWLYRMNDRPIQRYWPGKHRPSYLEGILHTDFQDTPSPLQQPVSYPVKEQDQIRLLALRRDQYTCQHCQTKNVDLQVHHVVPVKQGGQEQLDNLITLCHSCHHKIHHG